MFDDLQQESPVFTIELTNAPHGIKQICRNAGGQPETWFGPQGGVIPAEANFTSDGKVTSITHAVDGVEQIVRNPLTGEEYPAETWRSEGKIVRYVDTQKYPTERAIGAMVAQPLYQKAPYVPVMYKYSIDESTQELVEVGHVMLAFVDKTPTYIDCNAGTGYYDQGFFQDARASVAARRAAGMKLNFETDIDLFRPVQAMQRDRAVGTPQAGDLPQRILVTTGQFSEQLAAFVAQADDELGLIDDEKTVRLTVFGAPRV